MKKIYIGFMVIAIVSLLMLSGCTTPNPINKSDCENSGGTYKQGVSSGGVSYFCSCPIDKYETSSKTCATITQTDMTKCESLSNQGTVCSNSKIYNTVFEEGVCECEFSSGVKTFLVYKDLLEGTCRCTTEDCVCLAPAKRR